MRFWARDEEHADWPEPRAEFLSGLADSVREARHHAHRDVRSSRFPLRLAPALVVALVLAVAAFAGASTATGGGGGIVKSFKSVVLNNHSDHHDSNVPDAKDNKGGHDEDEDDDDDDENEGQYDQYDHHCDNGDRHSFEHQRQLELRQLLQALTAPHPGVTAHQLRVALAQHQLAALRVFKAERDRCKGDHGHHGGDD